MPFNDNRRPLDIIDRTTGEFVRTIRKGDKIIPKRIYENWVSVYGEEAADAGYEALNIGTYCKISDTATKILREMKLSALEHRLILYFLPMVHWNSNLLAHKNKKPLTVEWLAKKLDVSEASIERSLRLLRTKGIIFVGTTNGNKKTFFNPYIFFKGKYILGTLKEMFIDTEFYRAWAELPMNRNLQ